MIKTTDLLASTSQHTETALPQAELAAYFAATPGWSQDGARIVKTYQFKNYYETLAFINAIAYVIHAQDHHPELVVSFNRCVIKFDTHTVNDGHGGISVNDFICAAKVDAVFEQSFS
ncbi:MULTISPECIES: 4a-hydroxytetrahydrobiopterin dehydratase [unclassified Undibacterium]|uniref:4a-hydroxytetrahydrobiopterin dehydratase n=1 Tax=unclassified Undibacterium TaxID=2630295 RepID=UPI002AC9092B|nr:MULTISPECIES: 4a-hydroxytetrahydrobiopterin dehydratase [unclassified Undibacterium]MEB0138405.1 4a-hydroxytetrahydrobiopterin dehydratase [Undibacterium sp. CCC2.1]MEB0171280.1 4a-hydroxytetrahydrobiopterin dehydratase [Undibacterium sp. CCC1.1]MEB0176482.1 4a-hydroxytetrahydrobiopterin dehydratase [Undibacterium sp. CCC3.4]MEB0214034.1 4a-hydroxytetrahydrobiopterin dehydratase [Undibacterium sp. 5I2]WPX43649.1 4a-hydroxytetrahydrobiopterin dehydratase [Undibacterium sp. CCC3.4]